MIEEFIDKAADVYESIHGWVASRPVQLLSYLVAALIIMGVYTFFAVSNNSSDINEVKSAFCNSDGFNRHDHNAKTAQQVKCQRLFSKLLEHPTHAQAQRLKQIIKETP